MAAVPNISITTVLEVVLGIVILLIASNLANYDILDMLGLGKKATHTLPGGIERIFTQAQRPLVVDVGGGMNATVEYGDILDATSNWIVEMRGEMIISHLPWSQKVRRNELMLNLDAPREFLGSNAIYVKWIKGGVENMLQQKLEYYEKFFKYQDGQIANLEASLRQLSMSKEAQMKIEEGLEAIKNRQRFRKQSVEGLGFPGGGTAGLLGGQIGGT